MCVLSLIRSAGSGWRSLFSSRPLGRIKPNTDGCSDPNRENNTTCDGSVGGDPVYMTILDAPTREECLARRERTNTPLQALLLMNEHEYLKAARALAARVLREDPDERLAVAYETITAHRPDVVEAAALREALAGFEELYRENPALAGELVDGAGLPAGSTPGGLAAWTMLVSTIYNLDITKSRQ